MHRIESRQSLSLGFDWDRVNHLWVASLARRWYKEESEDQSNKRHPGTNAENNSPTSKCGNDGTHQRSNCVCTNTAPEEEAHCGTPDGLSHKLIRD